MTHRALILVTATLAISACAPGSDTDESAVPSKPPGFELAVGGKNAAPATAKVADLTVDQVMAAREGGNIRLIDVRRAEEVAQGKIPGAEHIPLDDFDPAKLGLDDGRDIILYCRSGRRSAIAGERLSDHTGQPAQHLDGGFLAWKEAGGAVE